MHHGKLTSSPRLQRVHRLLKDADRELSTMEIIAYAQVMAVSAVVSELRENGAEIVCRRVDGPQGPRWFYRMTKAAPESAVG